MGNTRYLLLLLIFLIVFSLPRTGNAQSVIDCTIVYKYANQGKAIREQIWEEGWGWSVESDDSFQIARKTSTSAQFQSPQHDAKGVCTITFTNNFDQICTNTFSVADIPKNKKDTMTIILNKYYNKVVLKNKAGIQISGDVYFGASGITELADLENGIQCYKCPPAAGGGYSFPSIDRKGLFEYSIYIPDSKKGFSEVSFQARKWYGRTVLEDIKVE